MQAKFWPAVLSVDKPWYLSVSGAVARAAIGHITGPTARRVLGLVQRRSTQIVGVAKIYRTFGSLALPIEALPPDRNSSRRRATMALHGSFL